MANPFKLFDEEHERLLRLFSQLAFLSKDMKDKKDSIIEKKETHNYYLSIKSLPIIIEYEYILEELDKYLKLHDDLIRKVDLYSDVLMNECKEYLKNKEFADNIEDERKELEKFRDIEKLLKSKKISFDDVLKMSQEKSEPAKWEFNNFDQETKDMIKKELFDLAAIDNSWSRYSTFKPKLKKRLNSISEANSAWIDMTAYEAGFKNPTKKHYESMGTGDKLNKEDITIIKTP